MIYLKDDNDNDDDESWSIFFKIKNNNKKYI